MHRIQEVVSGRDLEICIGRRSKETVEARAISTTLVAVREDCNTKLSNNQEWQKMSENPRRQRTENLEAKRCARTDFHLVIRFPRKSAIFSKLQGLIQLIHSIRQIFMITWGLVYGQNPSYYTPACTYLWVFPHLLLLLANFLWGLGCLALAQKQLILPFRFFSKSICNWNILEFYACLKGLNQVCLEQNNFVESINKASIVLND